MSDEHNDPTKRVGVYWKTDDYRSNCTRGYLKNRWDAHHVLPAVSFSLVTDNFILDCLSGSDYDINKAYSMAGLPKLTAFILALQNDPDMPYDEAKEMTVTMRRWGTVKQYASQLGIAVAFPGNFPVHNPCNWGHTEYNEAVTNHLEKTIFKPLEKKKKKNQHFQPQDVTGQLRSAQAKFWGELSTRGSLPGGGGHIGIYQNLRHRYDEAKDGWWKPMCMVDLPEAPSSPSLR